MCLRGHPLALPQAGLRPIIKVTPSKEHASAPAPSSSAGPWPTEEDERDHGGTTPNAAEHPWRLDPERAQQDSNIGANRGADEGSNNQTLRHASTPEVSGDGNDNGCQSAHRFTQRGGVNTDIARDVFGKPTAITQRNAASTQSVTRRYVYDAYQQLCKTIEPETGSTVMAYDNVGNLTWSASGLALPSAGSCDTASVGGSQKISRSYDARNRLATLAFPDGNGNQTWNYTPDGLPFNVTTSNNAGSSTVTNSYTYNRRRLLTGEGQAQTGGFTWSIGYGYNANGHLTSLVHPSTLTVNYAPNALGQPTQAGIYASNVQYHPNGAMKQFTYGNGLVRTVAQNARQLTSRITDSGGVLDQSYGYDANGNVGSITDHTAAGPQKEK